MTRRATRPPPPPPARAPPPERWPFAVFALAAATLAVFVYLGARPGGRGPILAYRYGPPALGILNALALGVALVWSALRPPLVRPRRVAAWTAAGAGLWLCSLPLAYPSSHDGHPSAVRFRLPFDGEWTVRWGGERHATNALVLSPGRRYGFDFVRGDGADPEGSVGAPVLAPAEGEVVAVEQSLADDLGASSEGGPASAWGNHVVLRVAAQEFLVLGGLQQGSVGVVPGERVRAGQELARVGRSALSRVSPAPHLAVHLQDAPEPGRGEAIPMRFFAYESGGHEVEAGIPRGGLADGSMTGERVRAPVAGDGSGR